MQFRLIAATICLIWATATGAASRPSPASAIVSNPKVAYVVGEINRRSEFAFEMQMLRTQSLPGDRLIIIDSPGGEIEAGNEMLRMIEAEKARGVKVTCLVVHDASSMAFNILTHCDTRLAAPKAHMLVHKAAFYGAPDGARLTANELRDLAADLDKADAPFRRDNAKAMHMSLKDYDLFADKETVWSAETLLKMHYLSGIVPE